MFIEPMKAKKDNHDEIPGDKYVFEIKYDGVRATIVWDRPDITIYSKNGADITYKFPELTDPNRLGDVMLGDAAVFDAELVCFKDGVPSFSAITSRFHSKERAKILQGVIENPVTACLLDILSLGDVSYLRTQLMARKEVLYAAIVEEDNFHISKVYKDGEKLYAREMARGAEGIIAKRKTSLYLPGRRTTDWLKVKIMYEEDVWVYGFTGGLGKRDGYFGALLFCDFEGNPLGNVGTGFTDKELADMTKFMKDIGYDIQLGTSGPVPTYLLRKPFKAKIKGMRKNESGAIREPVFVGRIG